MQLSPCPIAPNAYEQVLKDATTYWSADLTVQLQKAYNFDALGKTKEAAQAFNKLNDYYYLLYYLILIKIEMTELASKGSTSLWSDMQVKYDIDCVKKAYACKGINITPIIEIFKFKDSSVDGISVMRVDPNSPNPIPFKVTPIND